MLASPSKVFAVPDPVISLLSALLFIVVPVTVLKVESPARNVDELAVPDPSLAVGTVPDDILDAFKAVNPDPLPVAIPVKNTSPSLLSVIPLPTKTPALAVIIPIESTLVTSS